MIDIHNSLIDEVRAVMASTFGVEEDELPLDVSQEQFGRWTSLSHLSLMLGIEERFGVSLSIHEITEMTSMQHILDALQRRANLHHR